MAKDSKKKPIPWAKSDAKFYLREDVISGIISKNMKAKDVYNMRPEYKEYKYENFRNNLLSLRKVVKRDLGRAELDKEYYQHDKHLFRGDANCEEWHTSEAYKVLKEDMKDGKVDGRKPKDIYNSRREYQAFSLKKVRNQIYVEQERLRKKKMIELGTHPRFGRLRHDPRKKKVESTEVVM